MFIKLYPSANILCVEPHNFTRERRQYVLKDIRDGDYDAIIIAYSSFELIPVSKDYYMEELKSRLDKISENAAKRNKVTAAQIKKRKELEKALKELEEAITDEYDIIYFDNLGINTMFVWRILKTD